MWDRKELKARGKAAFKANYWLAVLIAFILLLVAGGGTGAVAGSTGFKLNLNINDTSSSSASEFHWDDLSDIPASLSEFGESLSDQATAGAAAVVVAIILGVDTVDAVNFLC